MKINTKGIELIKSFEGCKLNAYLDSVNVPTIGFGATFYQNGNKIKLGDKITQQQANELLEFHINKFSSGIIKYLRNDLNDNQFSALVSFAFNLGINSLTISTLLKKVNKNPNDKTISDEFLKWNKARVKGKLAVLTGLTRRRKAESDLYFS